MANSSTSKSIDVGILSQEQIAQNMDKLNLRPELEFIENNMASYLRSVEHILRNSVLPSFRPFYEFQNTDKILGPQIYPESINLIISSFPKIFPKLSQLKKISYFSLIPVPIFESDGNFDGRTDWVLPADFPRNNSLAVDHPHRILIGCTGNDGSEIYQTPLPDSISKNYEARFYYQIHVFIHEFFHTIVNRDSKQLNQVKLQDRSTLENKEFTLEDFINSFEKLYLDQNRVSVSKYASTYSHQLNSEFKSQNLDRYMTALKEQMCECFAGYILNLLPTKILDFRHSFPQEYNLIDLLAKSELIQK